MKQEIFRMERVTYREQEVVKLEDFNLSIYSGEIMGMIPLNAHGKKAFLKLLQTNLPLYDGYIYYNGAMINSWKGADRARNRISVIQAGSSLVESMNITDNIFVLRQGFRQEIIRTKLLEQQIAPFLKDIGMDIPADTSVENLTIFERIIVELLRAVVVGHRLIVLDEIGMLLSYEELEKLYAILRHYAGEGFAFLYITPHFEEISRFCNRAALLSNGRIQKIILEHELADEVLRIYSSEYDSMVRYHLENRKMDSRNKEEILHWSGFCQALEKRLDFSVYAGECLILQVLESKVMKELVRVITGDLCLEAGDVLLDGKNVDFIKDTGVAVVQELPTKTMIFPELDYMENLCASLSQRMPSIWRKHKIRSNIRQEYGSVLGWDVFDKSMEELTEKQKYQLIYTRILLQKPQVVFCIHPFMGADMEHRMFIWKLLETLLDKGTAVVILSLGLSDSLSLADRLLVVEREGDNREILRKDFSTIPQQVPWTHLYKITN